MRPTCNETATPGRRHAALDGTARRARRRAGSARLLSIVALALLAALALGVIFVLPRVVEPDRSPAAPGAPSPAAIADAADARPGVATAQGPARPDVQGPARADVDARDRDEATQALGQVLRQQSALEALGVAAWGGEDYASAIGLLEDGDRLFGDGAFAEAGQAYRQVLEALRSLEGSMDSRHAAAVERGAAALARFDAAEAEAQFTVALAIEPDDADARRGLERAANIEEVGALLASGRAHEEAERLAEASRSYARAIELDPEQSAARDGLARVRARAEEAAFHGSMSDALAAIERGELDAAARLLEAAAELRPGSKAVIDARARLTTRLEARRIAAHRARAEKLAADERWSEAAAVYQAVLDIDPHLAFAVEGRVEAQALARIHRRLDLYLEEPARLASKQPLNDAKAWVETARGVDPKGPRLEGKLDALAELIALAETPVSVTLRSDGETDVTIYRVGRLGTFDTYQIMLRPGRYTAIGIRTGYRDVRRQFEVVAGRETSPIELRCEEPI